MITTADCLRDLVHDEPITLVDVRYFLRDSDRALADYRAGHLDGARFVALNGELADPPAESAHARPGTHPGGRHPKPSLERLTRTVQRLGVEPDLPVIAYDQGNNFGAAWFWWLLRDAGHRHVRVLDGGIAAWVAAGGELVTDVVPDGHGSFVPEPGQLPQVDAAGVQQALGEGRQVVDVRAAARFRGEGASGLDPIEGHIPGAINIPTTEYATDHGFVGVEQRRALMAGLKPGDVLSCGSGITAAQALLAAESAGVTGLQLYPGSWSDWISDPARPVS